MEKKMGLEKEEIVEKIIGTLKAEGKKVNPAFVSQKNKWNKDQIKEICALFGVSSFNEVLESIPGVKLEKDSKATPSVWYEETPVTPPPFSFLYENSVRRRSSAKAG